MKQSPKRRSLALAAHHRGRDGAVQGKRFESPSGPATLGTTAKADLLLRTWCRDCRHAVDVDPGGQAERYGANLPVPEWVSRLVCSRCGSRAVDFVVAPRSTGGTV